VCTARAALAPLFLRPHAARRSCLQRFSPRTALRAPACPRGHGPGEARSRRAARSTRRGCVALVLQHGNVGVRRRRKSVPRLGYVPAALMAIHACTTHAGSGRLNTSVALCTPLSLHPQNATQARVTPAQSRPRRRRHRPARRGAAFWPPQSASIARHKAAAACRGLKRSQTAALRAAPQARRWRRPRWQRRWWQ
jgi:hypothetical protein